MCDLLVETSLQRVLVVHVRVLEAELATLVPRSVASRSIGGVDTTRQHND